MEVAKRKLLSAVQSDSERKISFVVEHSFTCLQVQCKFIFNK